MIHSYDWAKKKIKDTGWIVQTGKSMVYVEGLERAVLGEGISFESGEHGVVTKINNHTEVMVFSDRPMELGVKAARTGESLKVSVGEGMLGDTFDALGHIQGGEKDASREGENREVDVTAGGISTRTEISEICETGVTIVDTMVPIARGQRELIMGDQKTGKSSFVLQTVRRQAELGSVCVIALIGKQPVEIARTEQYLVEAGVRDKCVIVAERADASAARIYLTPYTAMTVAEYFRDRGQDVLLVLDDLSTHALRYREMSLMAERFPGRDSYPGDIFYIHAKLLERAGNFRINQNSKLKDQSKAAITCLPIAETVEGDMTGFVQTNLMSMTDGHIFFDKQLFLDGVRPAVNVFLSVTRVGRQTQSKVSKEIGRKVLEVLNKYDEVKRFLRFGPELTPEVQETIRLAHGVKTMFTQRSGVTVDIPAQQKAADELWGSAGSAMSAGSDDRQSRQVSGGRREGQ